MSNIVYLNGKYSNAEDATISVFDRGVLFADSIYEVIPVYSGRPFFVSRHLERLQSNLQKIQIDIAETDWLSIFNELINRNGGGNLQVYLQITRGNEGVRKHDIPKGIKPTVFAFTLHAPYPTDADKRQGLQASIIEDFRWLRCDIKSNAMLANIMLNDTAVSTGAQTALLSRDGFLTEGSSSNIFIVDANGVIKTPPLNNFCLPGITRQVTIELIKALNLPFREELIPITDIFNAQELMITSTTKEIYPVTRVNGHQIGTGCGGPYWEQLNTRYHQLVEQSHD